MNRESIKKFFIYTTFVLSLSFLAGCSKIIDTKIESNSGNTKVTELIRPEGNANRSAQSKESIEKAVEGILQLSLNSGLVPNGKIPDSANLK